MSGGHDHAPAFEDVQAGLAGLGKAAPEVMRAFGSLHRAAMADGSLPKATKQLTATTARDADNSQKTTKWLDTTPRPRHGPLTA